MSYYTLESKIETLCDQILKAESENWDAKNRAVLQLTDLILEYDGHSASDINDAFTPNIYRTLKEPIKLLISDLRSQQVRDTCIFLVQLARITGEKMKPFLRDSFTGILEAVKVPNKVMSGYVDECILSMIRYTIFKSAIPTLAMELKENKAKFVREKCLEYINEILLNWELAEKDFDQICEALRVGLEDASPKAREIARIAFVNVYKLHPKKAEKLRMDMPKQLQSKLMEEILKCGSKGESISSMDSASDAIPATPSTPSRRLIRTSSSSSSKAGPTMKSVESLNPTHNGSMSSMPEESGVRGSLNRRRSVVKNPFAELSGSYSEHPSQPTTPRGGKNSSPTKRRVNLSVDVANDTDPGSLASTPNTSPSKQQFIDDADPYPSHLSVGMKVLVNAGKELRVPGTVRFIGPTLFASGIWIGVELNGPHGKNNGSVQGHFYFECPPSYGLFLRDENVNPFIDETKSFSQDTDAVSSSSTSGTEKKSKSTSVLKVKLSQMMELLNKQLEIVEELEREEKSGAVTPTSSVKCSLLRDEVFKISCKEMELIENFCHRWKEFCPDS